MNPERRRIRTYVEEVRSPQSREAPQERQSPPTSQQTQTVKPVVIEEQGGQAAKGKNISTKLLVVAITVAMIVTFLLVGGVFLYISSGTTNVSFPGSKPPGIVIPPRSVESSPSPQPQKQEEEAFDPAEFGVAVFNGSGVAGAASDVEALLEEEGFTVATTANASEFGLIQTVVEAKRSVPARAIEAVLAALSPSYEVRLGETLPSSSEFDIVITVGEG